MEQEKPVVLWGTLIHVLCTKSVFYFHEKLKLKQIFAVIETSITKKLDRSSLRIFFDVRYRENCQSDKLLDSIRFSAISVTRNYIFACVSD